MCSAGDRLIVNDSLCGEAPRDRPTALSCHRCDSAGLFEPRANTFDCCTVNLWKNGFALLSGLGLSPQQRQHRRGVRSGAIEHHHVGHHYMLLVSGRCAVAGAWCPTRRSGALDVAAVHCATGESAANRSTGGDARHVRVDRGAYWTEVVDVPQP